jgi:UDP-N-acetylglucosamine 2-epimerase (non-hydrolysing)
MKILSVVGARPQFVKLAPVSRAATACGAEHVIVHTGQHYDDAMSQSFFDELGIPAPDVNLDVGSHGHAVQTGQMLIGLEPVLRDHAPDWVLVYGDTNSTLAAAVCATKLHLRLAHLEAGLRSFNRRMPEEHNRILTDHSADLCLAPTRVAMEHLAREGLADRSVLVGDVMTDVLLATADRVSATPVASPIPDQHGHVLATIHRPDNTDDPERLSAILEALSALDRPVYLAAHPRLVDRASRHGIELAQGAILTVPPLSYPQLVQAVLGSTAVVTDSGGLQKEAYLLGTPTTTIRGETEWVETLSGGWNRLVTSPSDIGPAIARSAPHSERGMPYGDGRAAESVLAALTSHQHSKAS